MLRTENVSGDEVVGKAAEGLASVSRGSIAAFALSLACASFHTKRRVGIQRGGCRVRGVVRRGFRGSILIGVKEIGLSADTSALLNLARASTVVREWLATLVSAE